MVANYHENDGKVLINGVSNIPSHGALQELPVSVINYLSTTSRSGSVHAGHRSRA